ncbi:hypothetical protein AB0F68_08170 [Micromonospora sp. NPDC023966]
MRRGEQPPWIVPDGLWQRIEPLLPKPECNPRRDPVGVVAVALAQHDRRR